jgi:cystathionine beta-synthase
MAILDEWDVLTAVQDKPDAFRDAVHTAMADRVETVGLRTSLQDLMKLFNQGRVAVVVEGGQFHGLITRMDVLNHLRNKAH